jgi:hypothetical protein
MRHVLARLSVRTPQELGNFEAAMRNATEGFAISRSMAYNEFRITVMRYQQTGLPSTFKNILSPHHFIETDNGTATLFRNVQDMGAPDVDHDRTPIDEYECPSDENETPKKRVKR